MSPTCSDMRIMSCRAEPAWVVSATLRSTLRAFPHGRDRDFGLDLDTLDHLGDFFGGVAGALCQLTNFDGNHGKFPALLSGPRSFDGGVQGQQIGLVGNVVDYADDLSCLVRLLAQFLAKKT
jgi:hypothetical protein